MKKGWEIKKLGEICRFINGRAYSQHELLKEGKYPVLRVGNFYTNRDWYYSDLELPEDKYCDKGDLLYAWSASFGPRIWDGEKVIYHYHIWKVEPIENLIRKDFLFQLLEWDTEAIKTAHGTGTTMMHVGKGSIENRLIPLPPLPEQQRIVAILDEAFAAIAKAKANAEQNLKNAKELFESYLQGVFENKGEGWEENRLEELADEKCTLSYGIVQPGEEFENGLPVIRPTDLTNRFINLKGLKRIDPKLADGYKRTKLIGDEILLCVRGTTGTISIATKELNGANVTRGIVPIRFNSKIINQEFGYYLLISNYIQKQIKAKTYGAALMQINIGDLRKIETAYPTLKTQLTIVQKLDALSAETKKLESIYQQKINDLEELKKSVLQKAFSGELLIVND
ncbi:MAG: restriction endonuclease subunit S [Bacteroidetes bacterium]|nr:restriction endonuclease subunit S [Bacteroidota bacterium]MBK8487829.1 restriction endonuclease subunit S [Bacteroidota bacterium]